MPLTEIATLGDSGRSQNSNNSPSNSTAAAAAAPTAGTPMQPNIPVFTSLAPGDLPNLPWIKELVISIFVLLIKYNGWLIYYAWYESVGYLRVFRIAVFWIPTDIVFLALYIVGCVSNLNPPTTGIIPNEWPPHSWPPDWLRYCLLMVLAGLSLPVPAYVYIFGWDHLALPGKAP